MSTHSCTQRLGRDAIHILVGMVGISCLLAAGCGDPPPAGGSPSTNANANAGGGGSPVDVAVDVVVTRADVLAVLNAWRASLLVNLPAAEKQDVDSYVAGFPIDTPEGVEPIEIVASDDADPVMTAAINRRDWAYAYRGAAYTMVGGFTEDQSHLIDVGMWCFVEAALLVTDEPEHLTNVAFHLNEKGEYADARIVLRYAVSIDDAVGAAWNNLAFSYNSEGDADTALAHQIRAVQARSEVSLYVESMAIYADQAGESGVAELARAMLDDGTVSEPPSPDVPGGLSVAGFEVFTDVLLLAQDMIFEMTDYTDAGIQAGIEALDAQYVFDVPETRRRCVLAITHEQLSQDPLVDCRDCYFPEAAARWNLSLGVYQLNRNFSYAHIAHMTRVRNDFLSRGLVLIEGASISSAEKASLSDYWARLTLANLNGISSGILEDLRLLWESRVEVDRGAMNQLPCVGGGIAVIEEDDPLCRGFIVNYLFCTKWELSLFFVGFSFDPDKETMELSLGQGLQGKFEYNFRKNAWRLGVGVGVNLDRIIRAGTTARYGPDSGFDVTAEVKAGIPSVLPTPEAPPIAKLAIFTNH